MFTNEIIMHVGQNVNINNYRSQYQGFQEANIRTYDASVFTSVYIQKIPNQHATEILTH